jgi:capsid protein
MFESVNPLDDAQAELIEMRSGTLTLFDAIARRGWDPEQKLRETAKFLELSDELGLTFDSDPRKVAKAGTEQPSQYAGKDKAPRSGPLRAV